MLIMKKIDVLKSVENCMIYAKETLFYKISMYCFELRVFFLNKPVRKNRQT